MAPRNLRAVDLSSFIGGNAGFRKSQRTAILSAAALLSVALLWAGPAHAQAPPEPAVLTIEQAIQQAAQNNRRVQTAQLEIYKARSGVAMARSRRLPNISLGVQAFQLLSPLEFEFDKGSFGRVLGVPVPPFDVSIEEPRQFVVIPTAAIIQPLSQQHRLALGVRQALAAENARREALRGQQQTTATDTRNAYYAILQTQQTIDAQLEAIKFLREFERTVQQRVEAGTALQADLLEVRARLAKQNYDLTGARNQLAQQEEQLNQLIGRDVRTAFRVAVPAEISAELPELTALQERALRQRAELRQAELGVRIADLDTRIARSEYVPDLTLSFQALHQSQLQVVPQNFFQLGLTLSWEPWDWGRRRANIEARKRTAEQVRLQRKDAEDQVLIDVNTRYRQFGQARELVAVSTVTRDAARERLRVTVDRYGQNLALLRDVLEAQAALADTNRQYQQAVWSAASARAELQRALGEA
jgi:outer membrane protein TolC